MNIRNNYKLLAIPVMMLLYATACTDHRSTEENTPGEINLRATLIQSSATTRADDALPAGNYLLHPPVGSYNTSAWKSHSYLCNDAGVLSPVTPIYWDDIKAATDDKNNTAFYLTSADITGGDILWGGAKGWNAPLLFKMEHCMARITIALTDNTIDKDLDFKNAKVVFATGLFETVEKFDIPTGNITTADDRVEETTISHSYTSDEITAANAADKIELTTSVFPPQTFATGTQLHITAGKYVFTIDLPPTMKVKNEGGVEEDIPIALVRGQHLTMNITLSEKTIGFTATLRSWNDKAADDIDVTRVFNISNWNELRDLMQAIESGYTFKGMVVRLTQDIEISGQIHLGTEKYPFEGIFDGNGKNITNMGSTDNRNGTALFAYARGATIQNLNIIAPAITSKDKNPTGAIVDRAEDTTLYNNKVEGGVVTGEDYTGGMVGIATGKTSLTNCYASITVYANGGAEYVGGLIGYSEGTITHCSAKGEIAARDASYVGGLAGYTSGNVLHCFAWGQVLGDVKVGGLIGFVDGSVSNSYAKGLVEGVSDIGGLFGNIGFDGTAGYCYWYNHSNATYGGTGSASLTNCEAYTEPTDIVTTEKLNKNYPGVWIVSGTDAVFSY